MADIYIGRQPIFDTKLNVYGYELLFRDGNNRVASFKDLGADGATSVTIINAFLEMGLEKLVADRIAFINLTERFIIGENALPISPRQVVLEVLEDIVVSDELIESIQKLKERGFVIALDDFIYHKSLRPLISLADIIKIDLMNLSREELLNHVDMLKKFPAKLLAEKIETLDEFELCRKLGFHYFQGYFLSKPKIIKSKALQGNKLAILNLLAVLQNPDSEVEEIEEAISFDVSISYKILKLLNSALFNFPREIDSIRKAIIMLGRKQLCSWASMMALSGINDQPSEMIRMTMIRAKMCELLAEKSNSSEQDMYFTAGMFSALDILMQRDMETLLQSLPLSQQLKDALMNHEGDAGEAIACVMDYEVSAFDKVEFKSLTPEDIRVANVEAVTWADMALDQ